jgi:hypothetical protein
MPALAGRPQTANMNAITLNLSFAKNALFVRQTLASAFGIPLDREFTWDALNLLICDAARARNVIQISVEGLSQLGVALPDEAKSFRELLGLLRAQLPHLKVLITLHD